VLGCASQPDQPVGATGGALTAFQAWAEKLETHRHRDKNFR
jgi:hypothetical protein